MINFQGRIRQVLLIALCVVGLAALATLSQRPHAVEAPRPASPPDSIIGQDPEESDASGRNEDTATKALTDAEKESNLFQMIDELSIDQRRPWELRHGYYHEMPGTTGIIYPTHSYESLDDSSLAALVEANDMLAAAVLGDRNLGSLAPGTMPAGLKMHRLAAAMGSTYSINVIGGHYLGTRQASDDPTDKVERYTEALAWLLVGADAGDAGNRLAFYFQARDRDISAARLSAICDRADEIAGELAAIRTDLNFGAPAIEEMPGFEDLSGLPDLFSNPCGLPTSQ